MKKYAVIVLCLFLGGCFMPYPAASNSDKSLDIIKDMMGKTNEKTDRSETGTKGLVDVKKDINITASDSANVTITSDKQSEGEAEATLKVMEGEIANLTKDLKYERNAKTELESSFKSSETIHYRVHIVSGFFLVFFGIGLLLIVFAFRRLAGVLRQFGIDPKIAGKALGKLTEVFHRSKKDNSSVLDTIHRRLADNNLSDEVRHELEWFEKVITKDLNLMKEYDY